MCHNLGICKRMTVWCAAVTFYVLARCGLTEPGLSRSGWWVKSETEKDCSPRHLSSLSMTTQQQQQLQSMIQHPKGFFFCILLVTPGLISCFFQSGFFRASSNQDSFPPLAPCGLWGCKNWPTPFPSRMSYKATKPSLVSVLYFSMHYTVLLFIRAPFYISLVFVAMCSVFWLFWLSYQYLPSDWLERLICVPHSFVFPWAVESSPLQFLALA